MRTKLNRISWLALWVISISLFAAGPEAKAQEYKFVGGQWVARNRTCDPRNPSSRGCAVDAGEYCQQNGPLAGSCICRWGATETILDEDNNPQVICELVGTGSVGWGLSSIAAKIANWLMALTVMAGAVGIVIGGYFYMTAGGSGDRIREAKLWIGAALLGIFIALAAYAILNFISPSLTP